MLMVKKSLFDVNTILYGNSCILTLSSNVQALLYMFNKGDFNMFFCKEMHITSGNSSEHCYLGSLCACVIKVWYLFLNTFSCWICFDIIPV